MHVGHLRSTVIGDALVRVLECLGHDVVRQNHIGDWGTPFGMLIEHLLDVGEDEAAAELSVGDLDRFYQEAREQVRRRRRASPSGPGGGSSRSRPATPRPCGCGSCWSTSRQPYFPAVYDRLGVLLADDDIVGESGYNTTARRGRRRARRAGAARASTTAPLCVFPPGFTGRDGEPLPLIVRKSRRRLRLRRHRPGRHPLPRSTTSARPGCSTSSAPRSATTSRWSSRSPRMAGWLAPPARRRARRLRQRARRRRQDVQDPGGRDGQAGRPARRGGRPGRGRRRREEPRPRRRRGAPRWPTRSASAR